MAKAKIMEFQEDYDLRQIFPKLWIWPACYGIKIVLSFTIYLDHEAITGI